MSHPPRVQWPESGERRIRAKGFELTNFLVRLCLHLEASPSYQRAKAFARDLLDNPRSRMKRWLDLGMIALVLISVGLLVYSVENPVRPWMLWLEYVAVTVFIIEYLARVWIVGDLHRAVLDHYREATFLNLPFSFGPVLSEVGKQKWAYVSSPLAIIDLLAILPSYRPIRLLRVFLLFRLFKLFRYARSVHGMAEVLSERRFEFYVLGFFMIFVVLAAASAIYVFEGPMPSSRIDTYADAVYWSMVTLSTVGYGDIVPLTPEGRAVAMALIVSGIGILAFSTSIVVAAFQGKLKDLREHRVLSELEKGNRYTIVCGFGEMGQVVAAKLSQARQRFVVIEIDEARVRGASKLGFLSVHGDAADNALLEAIGVRERAHTLICVTADDVKNVFITVSARRMNDGLRIIARAGTQDVARKLTLAGANHVVSPPQIVGLMGAEYVGRPVAFEAIYGILRGERDIALEAVHIESYAPICGRRVADLDFAARKLLLFGIITTSTPRECDAGHIYPLDEGFCFVFKPSSWLRVNAGDILVIFGYEYSLTHLRRELGAGLFRSGLG
jgi:voltage-gated potassium channel